MAPRMLRNTVQMETIAAATEAEMVALFVRSELESPGPSGDSARAAAAGFNRDFLLNAPVEEPLAQVQRAALLGCIRGYRQDRFLFQGFPDDMHWEWVSLDADDVDEIHNINEIDDAVKQAHGTRLVAEGARMILEGTAPDEALALSLRLREFSSQLAQGEVEPPATILVSTPERDRIVVLEGFNRLTAYAMTPQVAPPSLALLGESPNIVGWLYF